MHEECSRLLRNPVGHTLLRGGRLVGVALVSPARRSTRSTPLLSKQLCLAARRLEGGGAPYARRTLPRTSGDGLARIWHAVANHPEKQALSCNNCGARYWRLSVSSRWFLPGCRVWGRAREVTCLKSRCAGCQLAARDDRAAPECPPGPAFCVTASPISCRYTMSDRRRFKQRMASL